jgi:lysylphosphatidylglycerol synthetase-like protein (DUF2156 family)
LNGNEQGKPKKDSERFKLAKDKAYGGIIFIISILILIGYSYWAILLPIFPTIFLTNWIPFLTSENAIWAIRIPVYIAVLVILLIAAWIGWTMATTPAPAPIDAEDFEEEFEAEEEKTEETSE